MQILILQCLMDCTDIKHDPGLIQGTALQFFPDCLEAVTKNLHETYQCRMYSRELLMMGREDARNM
jgi:hypothetical protein